MPFASTLRVLAAERWEGAAAGRELRFSIGTPGLAQHIGGPLMSLIAPHEPKTGVDFGQRGEGVFHEQAPFLADHSLWTWALGAFYSLGFADLFACFEWRCP